MFMGMVGTSCWPIGFTQSVRETRNKKVSIKLLDQSLQTHVNTCQQQQQQQQQQLQQQLQQQQQHTTYLFAAS